MKSGKKHYFRMGLTIFVSLAAVVAFYFTVLRYKGLKSYLDIVSLALRPVMVGIVIAYVLCPVAKFLERQFRRVKFFSRAARPLSVLFTLIFAMGVMGLFCALILPQVADSIRSLVVDLPGMLEVQLARLASYLEADSDAAATVMEMQLSNYIDHCPMVGLLTGPTTRVSPPTTNGGVILMIPCLILSSYWLKKVI